MRKKDGDDVIKAQADKDLDLKVEEIEKGEANNDTEKDTLMQPLIKK